MALPKKVLRSSRLLKMAMAKELQLANTESKVELEWV
jgi:hypothetical protein